MKYLLDTHFVIWSVNEVEKLSEKIVDILQNPENEIYVSAINFWEISLKFSLGKLYLGELIPESFPDACKKMGFEFLNLDYKICSTYNQVGASHHKDPFDRMLIWQSLKSDFILISDDENVKKYTSIGLKVVW